MSKGVVRSPGDRNSASQESPPSCSWAHRSTFSVREKDPQQELHLLSIKWPSRLLKAHFLPTLSWAVASASPAQRSCFLPTPPLVLPTQGSGQSSCLPCPVYPDSLDLTQLHSKMWCSKGISVFFIQPKKKKYTTLLFSFRILCECPLESGGMSNNNCRCHFG